jgi:hypothetical protein
VGTQSVYMPPPFYQNLRPYWDLAFKRYSAKGSYLTESTMVSSEFNLYRTKDETMKPTPRVEKRALHKL